MRRDGVIDLVAACRRSEMADMAVEAANHIVDTLSYKTEPHRFSYECSSYHGQLELVIFDRKKEKASIYIRGYSWSEIYTGVNAARDMMRLCIG